MHQFLDRLGYGVAISGGAGLARVWPGTVGAVVGIPIAFALTGVSGRVAVIVLIGLFLIGVWASGVVERKLGANDPQIIVIDETFGCAATLAVLPVEPLWWLAGFLAFRLLDIAKPWPIYLAQDKVSGGLGVMLDDAVAAILAASGLQLAQRVLAHFL